MSDMSRASLITDLKAALMDAAALFIAAADADFTRHLDNAASDLIRIAPAFSFADFTLVADQNVYDLPAADIFTVERIIYAQSDRNQPQWDKRYPGKQLRPRIIQIAGVRKLAVTPAPSIGLTSMHGTAATLSYKVSYVIDDAAANTTIPVERRGLLLKRAQAEAMFELANRGTQKPVLLRDGLSQMPRNGIPAALADQLMRECETQAAA